MLIPAEVVLLAGWGGVTSPHDAQVVVLSERFVVAMELVEDRSGQLAFTAEQEVTVLAEFFCDSHRHILPPV